MFDEKLLNKFLFFFVFSCSLFTVHCPLSYAAFEFKESGARGVALSGAYSARAIDATAPFWNPAALRLVSQPELTSFYSQLFSIGDLAYMGTAACAPTSLGGIGFGYTQFGPSAYREQQVLFSHAFGLADNVMAGYNLKGMFLKIEEYGTASAFGLDFGVLARIRDDLNVAVVGKNLNRPTIGTSKESLPSGFNAGVAFRPVKGLWISGEFERIDPNEISLKSGIEFMVAKILTLRGGVQNSPARFSGGLGFKAGIVHLDYAYQQHSTLSGSHEFSLSFKFGEPKEDVYRFKSKSSKKKKTEIKEKPKKSSPISSSSPAEPVKTKPKFEGQLNLNSATVEELTQIDELGIVTAGEIIKYREANGFKTIDDLLKVPKMQKEVFNSIKGHLFLAPVEPAEKKAEPAAEDDLPPLLEDIAPQPESALEKTPSDQMPKPLPVLKNENFTPPAKDEKKD